MKTFTLSIPDTVDLDDREAAVLFAAILYEQGKLSLGEAADLAQMPTRQFAERLGAFNVPLFNYPPSDLTSDVANA